MVEVSAHESILGNTEFERGAANVVDDRLSVPAS
jgi:hypothetical protein